MNKHDVDLNRVVFYSKEDMAGSHQLAKGESYFCQNLKRSQIEIDPTTGKFDFKITLVIYIFILPNIVETI